MKKVLMLSSREIETPPTKGGAIQTWMHEVSQRLSAYQTHIVSIGHPSMPDEEYANGVFYHRITIGRVYRRLFQKITRWDPNGYHQRALRIIESVRPDIVHIHNDHRAAEMVNLIRQRLPQTQVVLHLHNQIAEYKPATFPPVDLCLACSDFIRKHYEPLIEAQHFATLYNGVDVQRYAQHDEIRTVLHRDAPKPRPLNVVCFGRVSPEKGTDRFLDLAVACKDDERLNFHCVGEISVHGKRREFHEQMLTTIQREGLSRFHFHDVVPQDKMHLAYPMADIAVVPSRFEEPFGMVVIEAMANAIPTICAAKGGMLEYLQNGENALLVNESKGQPFHTGAQQALNRLLDEPGLSEHIKANALAQLHQRFDWLHIAQDLETIYTQTLDS